VLIYGPPGKAAEQEEEEEEAEEVEEPTADDIKPFDADTSLLVYHTGAASHPHHHTMQH